MKTKVVYRHDPKTRTGGYLVMVQHHGWVTVNDHHLATQSQAERLQKELRKHDYPEVNASATLRSMCDMAFRIEGV